MKDTSKMTLREVFEYAKKFSIGEGGLLMIIEKIVDEIENLEKTVNKEKI